MRARIINFQKFINESVKISDRFNQEESETLGMLMHDKGHVLGRGTKHKQDPILDSIFNKVEGEYYRGTLWRGVYEIEKALYEELYSTGDSGITTRYVSFSESKETAMLFSTQTSILIELRNSKGLLNYHQWIREIADEELEMNGGDTEDPNYEMLIEVADEELEHIMNIGTEISVVGKRREGDLTIYTIEQL
jgi:hypothetical protein